MRSFYSILYITLNAALNEKVGIGLVMFNKSDYQFHFSREKLSAFKSIMEANQYYLIHRYLESLTKELKANSSGLFKDVSADNWVSESYISYLSNYSNNSIQFSPPKSIDIDFNYSNFKRLFDKYIFKSDEGVEVIPEFDIRSVVKKKLFPKIENKVNLEIELTSQHFKNLIAPTEVDILGINHLPVAGQIIDFEKKHYFLESDITRFISLTKAIELEKNGDRGKYFILGKEPKKDIHKNHELWKHIESSKFLRFVDVDESEEVKEYLDTHGVRPFFP